VRASCAVTISASHGASARALDVEVEVHGAAVRFIVTTWGSRRASGVHADAQDLGDRSATSLRLQPVVLLGIS